jgi:hypothetical protein
MLVLATGIVALYQVIRRRSEKPATAVVTAAN